MNFTFFHSFFKKNKQDLQLPDSLLVKKLKEICEEKKLLLFENKTIFHHNKAFFVPLFILDPNRGLYLFEYKEWSYDDLKNATITKAKNQEVSDKSLSFENTHEFIKQKFNELTHTDGVEIFNFLLMENLNADEYEHLDISFKELLPRERVMFNDSSKDSILQKLRDVKKATPTLPKIADIIGNLLIQYIIYHDDGSLSLCTQEQRDFIDAKLTSHHTLFSQTSGGKTSVLLLKAIFEKLKNPQLTITIIEPTTLACDILKQKLINTIEHAIVEVDITSIQIITPLELINKHLAKLKKPFVEDTLYIQDKLMKSHFHISDLILCDDSELLGENFIAYLHHIQEKSALLLVTNQQEENTDFVFSEIYHSLHTQVFFEQGNELAKTLHLIAKLLKQHDAKDILVVSNSLSKEKLNDDLEFFIRDKAILLDSSKNLIDQKLDSLVLSTYEQISGLHAKYVILLDICHTEKMRLDYAKYIATDSLYLVYEQECEVIKEFQSEYKNQQNTTRVESTT